MRNVAIQFHWNPFILNRLYLDDLDELGLFFWERTAIEYNKPPKK